MAVAWAGTRGWASLGNQPVVAECGSVSGDRVSGSHDAGHGAVAFGFPCRRTSGGALVCGEHPRCSRGCSGFGALGATPLGADRISDRLRRSSVPLRRVVPVDGTPGARRRTRLRKGGSGRGPSQHLAPPGHVVAERLFGHWLRGVGDPASFASSREHGVHLRGHPRRLLALHRRRRGFAESVRDASRPRAAVVAPGRGARCRDSGLDFASDTAARFDAARRQGNARHAGDARGIMGGQRGGGTSGAGHGNALCLAGHRSSPASAFSRTRPFLESPGFGLCSCGDGARPHTGIGYPLELDPAWVGIPDVAPGLAPNGVDCESGSAFGRGRADEPAEGPPLAGPSARRAHRHHARRALGHGHHGGSIRWAPNSPHQPALHHGRDCLCLGRATPWSPAVAPASGTAPGSFLGRGHGHFLCRLRYSPRIGGRRH